MTTKESQTNNKNLIIILASVIVLLSGIIVSSKVINTAGLSHLFGGKVVVAPEGSRLSVTLATSLSSGINRIGDLVSGTVSSPIIIGSDTAIPAGSQVTGEVSSAVPAERFKAGKGGFLSIRLTSLQTPDGKRYPVSTSVYSIGSETGGSRLAKGLGKTAIGAGTGALLGTAIGAIAGGMPGRGAWSGAAIGGGVGAAGALISKGSEARIYSGAQISVVLEQPLQVIAQKQ